ncbi:MAG: BBP7 family outer membrane beta-barrel protein [Planctomycetes bacterium]|nr:BBP7 family outer membrane beta-barrel protein [Planctomycetota bacterium]
MKALIKGGLCVALGWLGSIAGAQEVPIKWQSAGAKSDAAVRPVTLNQPTPLDGFAPIIRGQAADDKKVPAVPKLEIIVEEPKQPQKLPKDKGFTPPPPQPMPTPTPIFDAIMPDGCGIDDCGSVWRRGRFFRGGDDGCCPDRSCFWASAESLLWWQKNQNVPPLITGTSPNSTAPIGVLPNATVLYDSVPNPVRSGGRFALGWWCPHFCNNLGVEVDYFFLGRTTSTRTFGPETGLFLGRPFFSVLNNGQNAEVFNGRDRTGDAFVSTYSQLWGMEANFRYKWLCGSGWWIDAMAGYRHITLTEGIEIGESLTITTPGINQGFNSVERESWRTRNMFNGGQFGLQGECRIGERCFFGFTSKMAMGGTYEVLNAEATTTRTLPNSAPVTAPGALLITQTNLGRTTATRFCIVPEVNLKIGYDITDHLRVWVGYDVLYMSNVIRPGEQIDLRVNSDLRPFTGNTTSAAPRVPATLFRTSDYWAQGLNFGLMWRY